MDSHGNHESAKEMQGSYATPSDTESGVRCDDCQSKFGRQNERKRRDEIPDVGR